MVRLAKRLAVLAVAGTLTATSLTGCGTINTDETVATVGDEKITLGVANFYARLQQAQYETYDGNNSRRDVGKGSIRRSDI